MPRMGRTRKRTALSRASREPSPQPKRTKLLPSPSIIDDDSMMTEGEIPNTMLTATMTPMASPGQDHLTNVEVATNLPHANMDELEQMAAQHRFLAAINFNAAWNASQPTPAPSTVLSTAATPEQVDDEEIFKLGSEVDDDAPAATEEYEDEGDAWKVDHPTPPPSAALTPELFGEEEDISSFIVDDDDVKDDGELAHALLASTVPKDSGNHQVSVLDTIAEDDSQDAEEASSIAQRLVARKRTAVSRALSFATGWINRQKNVADIERTASPASNIDTKTEDAPPAFPKFMELPKEIRQHIYSFVVGFDHPLRPLLCDHPKRGVRFHEETEHERGGGHDEVYNRLAITRANKEVRQESLPIFYSINTFHFGMDTLAYFDNLSTLGRLDMVRRISFAVPLSRSEERSDRILKDIFWALDADKKGLIGKHGLKKSVTNASTEAGVFLLLRKLSKTFNDDERTVTLQTVAPEAFDELDGYRWFGEVAEGAGLKVKWVQGGEGNPYFYDYARITWVHRHQKGDTEASNFKMEESPAKVLKNAIKNRPQFLTQKTKRIFYRRNCRGGITWHEEV